MQGEEWTDDYDDDEPDEEESGSCPECGAEIYEVADKCIACGYWISEADRRVMWSGTSQSTALKIVTKVVLGIILLMLVVGLVILLLSP